MEPWLNTMWYELRPRFTVIPNGILIHTNRLATIHWCHRQYRSDRQTIRYDSTRRTGLQTVA